MLNNSLYLGSTLIANVLSLPLDYAKTQIQLTGSYTKVTRKTQFIGSDLVFTKTFISLWIKHKIFKSTYESDKMYLIPAYTCLAFIMSPFDHALVRLQTRHLQPGIGISNGFNTFIEIFGNGGLRALYRGGFLNASKNFSYFVAAEYANMTIFPYYVVMWKGFLGLVALVPPVLASHPFDVVKAHMQCVGQKGLGFRECCLDIYARLGIYGFYRGVSQAYVRSTFVLASTILSLEMNQLNN